uniref:GTPase-activating Rap/Ran-GAP domain-like protein 3 n=1 Tax=Myxine glutinosa TaxID=7769 RepID=UPI00358E1862
MSSCESKWCTLSQRSASEDLGCRRGVFSRKHYGSVELLISSAADGAIQRAGRFRVENGADDAEAEAPPIWQRTDVHLENPECHTRWYFKYFLGNVHQIYVGLDAERNPFFLSVVLSNENPQHVPHYKTMLWRKMGCVKICLPYGPNKTLSLKPILSALCLEKFEKSPREVLNAEIQKDLLVLEEQEGSVNFKFGVLYAKAGQLTDDEMFSNATGSQDFERFLNLLGERIALKGWTAYRGGLDTKNDTTGTEAVYMVYKRHEVIFHVSTLLPYSKENRQQVERKRHIGNDIVTIVFQEGDDTGASFKPSMIRSHFTHIFALVRYNTDNDSYRLRIFSEESVPLFGPPLPTPPIFTDHAEFRDFLLVKLINGEKATLETPTFAQKRQRTLDMLLRSMYQDHMPDLYKSMLNRRSLSDVLPESPRAAWRREEARQAKFVHIGQALKLKIIVKGDFPGPTFSTGRSRREPWEPQLFCTNFPHTVACADSLGSSLLTATEEGIFLLHEGQSPVAIFDRSFCVKQLSVLETQDLLLMLSDRGKESRLYAFSLAQLMIRPSEGAPALGKPECREFKLEKTRGCHLYALNTHSTCKTLRIVTAIRNRLLLAAWRGRPPDSPPGGPPGDGFQYIREICVPEVPTVLTLLDGKTGENDNFICVACPHHFTLLNESTGQAFRLHQIDASKVSFLTAIDLYEDGEAGLLLCYNYTCCYKKLSASAMSPPPLQPPPSDLHFCWNQIPTNIVCAFPYFLAFTADCLEVRLIVNGNLVHRAIMPGLSLASASKDIYFVSAELGATDSNSQNVSPSPTFPNSPQTPTPDDERSPPPTTPLATPETGESRPQHIYKIPLSSLVGSSIERPLRSPKACRKVAATSGGAAVGSGGTTSGSHGGTASLPPTRMEISEIATRTRRELLGIAERSPRKPWRAQTRIYHGDKDSRSSGLHQGALRSSSSDRLLSTFDPPYQPFRHLSTSSDGDSDKQTVPQTSPSLTATSFRLSMSFDEDTVDLK